MSEYKARVLPSSYDRVHLCSDIKRSRDPSILDTCDIVVDVGGIYDVAKQRFDHHQRGFSEVFGHEFNTKLSSAGLVYKCVGHHPTFPVCYSYVLVDTSGKRSFPTGWGWRQRILLSPNCGSKFTRSV